MGMVSSLGKGTVNCYVNSNFGSDSMDGRTAATAVATLSQALSIAGDDGTIALARGCEWREEIVNKPLLTVVAYGTGLRPKIIGRDVVTASWTKEEGYTNIYSISWTNSFPTENQHFHSVWQDGKVLGEIGEDTDLSTTLTGMDSTPARMYIEGRDSYTAGGATTIYIHCRDSLNPNNVLMEITKRGRCLQVRNAFDVHCFGNGHDDGAIVASTIERCVVEGGVTHNALCYPDIDTGDGIVRDVLTRNVRSDQGLDGGQGAGSIVCYHGGTNVVSNFLMENVTSFQDPELDDELQAEWCGPFSSHGTGSNQAYMNSMTLRNCKTIGNHRAFVSCGAETSVLNVYGCYADSNSQTIVEPGAACTEVNVMGNVFKGKGYDFSPTRFVYAGSVDASCVTNIKFNIICFEGTSGGAVYLEDGTVNIHNNIFMQVPQYMEVGNEQLNAYYGTNTDATVSMKNNVFYGISRSYYNASTGPAATLTSDYNVFYGMTQDNHHDATDYDTDDAATSEWNTAGFDTNSYQGDPGLLTDIDDVEVWTDMKYTKGGYADLVLRRAHD